jgi:hypothetical protein
VRTGRVALDLGGRDADEQGGVAIAEAASIAFRRPGP